MSHLANPLPAGQDAALPSGTGIVPVAAGGGLTEPAQIPETQAGREKRQGSNSNDVWKGPDATKRDSVPVAAELQSLAAANPELSDGVAVARRIQTSDSSQMRGDSLGGVSRQDATATLGTELNRALENAQHSSAGDAGRHDSNRVDFDARDPYSREAPSREDIANLKGRFLAVLNHEIRTPLSGIMGMTDLLMETKLDDEQREYVAATRACAETLFEVLNATLEYSALSGGRIELESAEFHVQEVVQAAIAEHQFRAESKGLRLYATFDEGLPETIYGDALRLRQLLSHLISNGVKFTPNGEVEVRLSPVMLSDQSARLRFEVRDTGIGIAREQLKHIFDSFRQIDSGLSRNYSGLGLGLALVEKLASLMKGSLHAESAIGKGSSFFVECSFLRGEFGGTTAASTTLPTPAVEPVAEAHILLVEDNDVAQRIYTHVLNRGNYQVDCAASGSDAIRLAHRRRYDLVLMDLQMPGVDGIEATKAMREIGGYEQVPILALTANSAEEHRRMCLENGMQGFLTKPLPSEELLASVAHYLRKG